MKNFDIYYSTHRDYDVYTGIATYLSSLGFYSETAVVSSIGETIRKNAAVSQKTSLQSRASAVSEKSASGHHVMALECDCTPSVRKPAHFAGIFGFLPNIHVTVRELLSSVPWKNVAGFVSSVATAVGYFDFRLPSVFGLSASASAASEKKIAANSPVGVQSSIQFRKDSTGAFSHFAGLFGSVGRVLTLNLTGFSHSSAISGSVTPMYVTLRTLYDMDSETLGTFDSMSLRDMEIKQTL